MVIGYYSWNFGIIIGGIHFFQSYYCFSSYSSDKTKHNYGGCDNADFIIKSKIFIFIMHALFNLKIRRLCQTSVTYELNL